MTTKKLIFLWWIAVFAEYLNDSFSYFEYQRHHIVLVFHHIDPKIKINEYKIGNLFPVDGSNLITKGMNHS
jgi:hypothetical protein